MNHFFKYGLEKHIGGTL